MTSSTAAVERRLLAVAVVVVAFCGSVVAPSGERPSGVTLFYSSLGGAGVDGPGIYAVDVDRPGGDAPPTVDDATRVAGLDVACGRKNDVASTIRRSDVGIKSVSFDAVSGRFLLHSRNRKDDRFSLAAGNVCQRCEDVEQQLRNESVEPYFIDVQISPATCKIVSFLMYHGLLFFLVERHERLDGRSKSGSIELRRLFTDVAVRPSACAAEPFPVTGSQFFDVIQCSELVAVVSRETFQKYPSNQALEGMLAVPVIGGHRRRFSIYLMVQHMTYDSTGVEMTNASIVLYQVIYNPSETKHSQHQQQQETAGIDAAPAIATAVPRYETPLESDYIRFVLYQRGSISYAGGTLCWSAVDRVLCGRLTQIGELVDTRVYLERSQTLTVCSGSDRVLSSVVTGVSLVDSTADVIAFYFGCVAQTPNMGGAGFLVATRNADSSTVAPPRVYSLNANNTRAVQAETMFVLGGDSDICRQPTASPQKVTGSADGAMRSAASCGSVLSLMVVGALSGRMSSPMLAFS